jgi:uncharacterized protein YraI
MLAGQSAEATTRPNDNANYPALTCGYRVVHVRPGSFLNLRSGPGVRYRPIGKLRAADGRIAGSCRATRHWVEVKSSNGRTGWASANYLHHARNPRVPSYPTLACAYQVSHVKQGGYTNVRSGPGLHFRPIGKLRAADGRIAGSCRSTRHWVAVKPPYGKAGWAPAVYLTKVR